MNNNKQSMKLYTEEQVKNLLNKMDVIYSLEDLTPIELPSDKEIIHESEFQDGRGRCEFIKGAEWVRNTIKNRAIRRN